MVLRAALVLLALVLASALARSQCVVHEMRAGDAEDGAYVGLGVDADGRLVLAGARGHEHSGVEGAAYVFDGRTGVERLELLAGDREAGDRFGQSVAIDERRALVGAPQDGDLGYHSGSAYLFDAVTGVQLRKLLPADGEAGDEFGFSVALDGRWAVVGAPEHDVDDGIGAAYAFDLVSGAQRKLEAATAYRFGYSVAIEDGRAIVGAPTLGGGGKAFVFDLATGAELVRLEPPEGVERGRFGASVALADTRAVVGDYQYADYRGTVHVFDLATGEHLRQLLAPDGDENDYFGGSVSVGGGRLLVGAHYHWHSPFQKSAYVFDLTSGELVVELLFAFSGPRWRAPVAGRGVAWAGDLAVVGWEEGPHGPGALLVATLEGDCDCDGVPDEEEPDCNGNGRPDDCEVADGSAEDADGDGIPDECECMGASYCRTSPNSLGAGARMACEGSASLAFDDLVLAAHLAAPRQPGQFFFGRDAIERPFGEGFLCVGGDEVLRLPPVETDFLGSAVFALGLDVPPAAGRITAGSTWKFQFWYRDPGWGGSRFNLSDGLAVTFIE